MEFIDNRHQLKITPVMEEPIPYFAGVHKVFGVTDMYLIEIVNNKTNNTCYRSTPDWFTYDEAISAAKLILKMLCTQRVVFLPLTLTLHTARVVDIFPAETKKGDPL